MLSALPRWVGFLALLAALFGGANAVHWLTFVPTSVGLVLVAVGAVAGALSTQLVGRGLPHGIGWLGVVLACVGALDAATIVPPGCIPSPDHACEAVRLLSLFPPQVSAVIMVVGLLLKSLAAARPADEPTSPTPGGF